MNEQYFLNAIIAVVGVEYVHTRRDWESIGIAPTDWESRAFASVAPHFTEEVIRLIELAEEAGFALIPCGGGTQIATGYPPTEEKPFLVFRTHRLNRVLDYQPDDMTITCEPGITLSALQQVLAEHGQFLPIDVPFPEKATLGGIVSANCSGFLRPIYGSPRDLLIGIKARINAHDEIKAGGKVVKNVAGYDLCKLFTGSWGTLGLITELTFKVRPLPVKEQVIGWEVKNLAIAAKVGLSLHHAQLAPAFVVATNAPNGRPRLIVGLHGIESRIAWQKAEFAKRVKEGGIDSECKVVISEEVSEMRNSMVPSSVEAKFSARIALLPQDVPDWIEKLNPRLPAIYTIHCCTGICHISTTSSLPSNIALLKESLPEESHLQWNLLKSSLAGEEIDLWGEREGERFLHQGLKQSLDVKNTFSPGRFYGKL